MSEQKSKKWLVGIKFVMFQMNRSVHSILKTSPYEAMFGQAPRVGLSTNITQSILEEGEYEDIDANDNNHGATSAPLRLFSPSTSQSQQVSDYDSICHICFEPTSGAHTCMGCKKPVHAICGDNVGEEGYGTQILCRRCVVNKKRANDRNMADEGQSQQAEKMCQKSSLTLPKLEIGDNVRLQIPKVDRGPADPKNLIAIVLEEVRDGLYRIGTKMGQLKSNYGRMALDKCEIFFSLDDVPDKIITLREAVREEFTGQGIVKCECKQKCDNNRCKCKRSNLKCNSKCHNSSTCKNK
jgi:hypothetical protein